MRTQREEPKAADGDAHSGVTPSCSTTATRPCLAPSSPATSAAQRGEQIDIEAAIDGLYAAGLVHVRGELVHPTLAARRVDQLYPLSI
jgi:hypothetical protein